jgi:hypothetical protein
MISVPAPFTVAAIITSHVVGVVHRRSLSPCPLCRALVRLIVPTSVSHLLFTLRSSRSLYSASSASITCSWACEMQKKGSMRTCTNAARFILTSASRVSIAKRVLGRLYTYSTAAACITMHWSRDPPTRNKKRKLFRVRLATRRAASCAPVCDWLFVCLLSHLCDCVHMYTCAWAGVCECVFAFLSASLLLFLDALKI